MAQTRTVACQSLGLVRRLDPNRVGGVDLSLADESVSQIPRSFRGGAAGAAKTSRKRQESLLLNGLRDLLLQVGQGEQEEVSEQPSLHRRPSPARGRGRGGERDRSPQRSRSPSPGWIVKGKGKRIGKPTDSINKPPVAFDSTKPGGKKGKGGSVATAEKRVQFLEKPQNQVGGGATLLAQLKALVLEADMHGCHDLVPRLSGLVQTFTKEPEERTPPKAPAEPRPRSQRQADHKIDKAWWPQGLVPFKKVCEALDAGEEPAGEITLAGFEQIVSLQALAKTHNVSKSFALVCSNEPEQKLASEYAGETKWVLFEGNRWKQVWVFPLLAQLPAWPSVPQIIQTKDPEDIGLVTVRVTISKQFLKQNEWEHAVKKPTDLLAAAIDEGSSWRTFGWHVIPKHEVIVGFMKVSSKVADSLLCGSGYRSCFFAKLDKIEARDPVKWIQRNEKSSPAQYLAEVRILAKEQKAGIALRKGTKSNLGLIGLKNEDKGEEALRKRWVARSVPNWAPCQFTNVLQTGGWRLIEEVQPPNKKGGVWIFKGVPPPSCPPQGVVLALETGKQVFICPWVPKYKKPDSNPIFTSRSWVTVANRGVLFQDHKECAPTQMDNSESQDDDQMQVDGTAKRPPNSPPSVTTPPKKKVQKTEAGKGTGSSNRAVQPRGNVGPDACPVWDLQGDGDCGFRILAAQSARRNGAAVPDIEAKISKLALSLRTKCVVTLKGNSAWRTSWFVDSDVTEGTEGGPIPKNTDEYCVAAARPTKWLDPWLAKAAADTLRTDILVWKFRRGSWNFLDRIRASNRTASEPMVMFLRNGHFTTIDPNTPFPPAWVRMGQSSTDEGVLQTFLGGGKRSVSDNSSQVSAWLKPQSKKGSSGGSSVSALLKPQSVNSSGCSRLLKPSGRTSCASTQGLLAPIPHTHASKGSSVAKTYPSTPADKTGRGLSSLKELQSPKDEFKKFTWMCPECHKLLKCQTRTGLGASKVSHMRSRHPDFDVRLLFQSRKKTPVATSPLLPQDERAWQCPLCDHGLPSLSVADRLRAMKRHCEISHPQETPTSLGHLNTRGIRKPGVQRSSLQKWEKHRKRKYGSHDIVQVPIDDAERKDASDRGSAYYCKNCLLKIQYRAKNRTTCKSFLKQYQKAHRVRWGKQIWWKNLQARRPKHTEAFLRAVGWTKAEVDQLWNVTATE